jgi:hypothetical protein
MSPRHLYLNLCIVIDIDIMSMQRICFISPLLAHLSPHVSIRGLLSRRFGLNMDLCRSHANGSIEPYTASPINSDDARTRAVHVSTQLDILRLDSRSSNQEEEEDRGEGHRPVESSIITVRRLG